MKKLLLLVLLFVSFYCYSSDLLISKPILYVEDTAVYGVFNVQWKNAWYNDRNHDAVWLFGKSKPIDEVPKHISVLQSGHEVVTYFKGESKREKDSME